MKSNVDIAAILRTYEIVQPKESQIAECIKQAQSVMQTKHVRRDKSLWFFIETQIKFMKGEMMFSFLLSMGLMLMLQLFKSLLKVEFLSEISVGIAPFLVVPIIFSMAKSKRDGMLELETASKLGLQRIIVVRIVANQALAIVMISLIWLISSAALENFAMNRLYFSLISFEITSICFLWFGKSSVKTGVFSAMGWMVLMWFLLAWEDAIVLMQKVNSMVLGLLVVVLVGISMMVMYAYMKNISFESEDKKWNLGWTD